MLMQTGQRYRSIGVSLQFVAVMVKITAAHYILRHDVHSQFTNKSQRHLNAKLHTNNLSLAETRQASDTNLLVDGICQKLVM